MSTPNLSEPFNEVVCDYIKMNPMSYSAAKLLDHCHYSRDDFVTMVKDLKDNIDHLATNETGQTCLMVIIVRKWEVDLLVAAVEAAGPESRVVNLQDSRGWTAVHYCAAYNAPEHLEALLAFNPDIEIEVRKPLHAANH